MEVVEQEDFVEEEAVDSVEIEVVSEEDADVRTKGNRKIN